MSSGHQLEMRRLEVWYLISVSHHVQIICYTSVLHLVVLTVFNLNADFRIPLIYGFTISDSINKNHLVIWDIQSRNIDLEICNHLWTKNIILTFSALLGVTDISTLTLLRNHQEIGSSPEKCRQLSVGRIQYTLCELYPVSFCLSVFSKV